MKAEQSETIYLSLFSTMANLTAIERQQYERDGYVIPGFALGAERVSTLVQTLDQLIAANPGVRPEN